MIRNVDQKTVESFGDEWERFDQTNVSKQELYSVFSDYFRIFPWDCLPKQPTGFDMGCGSGRWAQFVAPRVGFLHCIDPSKALNTAKKTLYNCKNVDFLQTSVDQCGLEINSQDFGYSLGVLHHVPNTTDAIKSCVDILKPGAPLLLYLYYRFDNRPFWFKLIWIGSNQVRKTIRTLPPALKQLVTDTIAATIYFPLSKLSWAAEKMKLPYKFIPLNYYRNCSYYTMRTDSRDRFGTPLEQRFTKVEIKKMCQSAGLTNLRFSDKQPYWCVVGFKKLSHKCEDGLNQS